MVRQFLKFPYLPLILAPFILLAPVYLTGRAMFWGVPALQFVPWRVWAWETLQSGHLPLWNPLLGMGAPLIANYQLALFYPPNWLYFALAALGDAPALAWGQALLVAAHLAFAAVGMGLLARRLGLNTLAQTISGLAFGLSGYLVARSGFLSINAAAAWLPWVMLGITELSSARFIRRGERRVLIFLAFCLGMQLLAGHAQTTWYTLVLGVLWGSFWAVSQPMQSKALEDEKVWVRHYMGLRQPAKGQRSSGGIEGQGASGSGESSGRLYLRNLVGWFHVWGQGDGRTSFFAHGQTHLVERGSPIPATNGKEKQSWREKIRLSSARLVWAWSGMGLALGFAVILAAVQLFPTAEYLLQSQRANNVDFELAMTYSFWPWRLITLIAPDMFGSPVKGDYWGYANYWEDAVYIGLLPLLLAVGAILKGFRKKIPESYALIGDIQKDLKESQAALEFPLSDLGRKREPGGLSTLDHSMLIRFLLALLVVSFILALGRNTPLYPWLYRNVPTFSMFQAPTRFILWAVFSLALLAGFGTDAWRRPSGRGLYWTRLGTVGALAVSAGAGLAWIFLGDISPSFIRSTALAGFLGIGAGLLSLTVPESKQIPVSGQDQGRKKQLAGYWQWSVGLFVVFDLLVAGWGLNPGIKAGFYEGSTSTVGVVRSLAENGRVYLPQEDERALKFDHFFRFDTFIPDESWQNLRHVLLPNLTLLEGLPSANNFDPLVPGRYARWMDALGQANPATKARMLNLMNVKVLEREDETKPFGVSFDGVEALPRLRWVPCSSLGRDEGDTLMQVVEGEVNLQEYVILEGGEIKPDTNCAGTGDAEIISENPNWILTRVKAQNPGYLVLADVWYPGWRAQLDGRSVPVLRANYLFRAVQLPAGNHQVVFVYQPSWFYLGALLSLVAWLGFGIVIWKGYNLRNLAYL